MKKVIHNSTQNKQNNNELNPKINIRLDFQIASEINSYIESLKRSGDFKYPSLSDFIRCALEAYRSGMQLNLNDSKVVPKKLFSLTVNSQIKELFNQLPKKNKTRIIESCILTFYKNDVT